MKKLIRKIFEDYKEEDFTVLQIVFVTMYLVLFILLCGFVEWLDGRW